MKTCFIVDDHSFTTEGLKAAITHLKLTCAGTAGSVSEAYDKLKEIKPDYVFLDHTIKNETGLDLLDRLDGIVPHEKFILVSQVESRAVVRQYADRGVVGFVSKASGVDEILKAILNGTKSAYFCPTFSKLMVREDATSILTNRELEVCRYIALGNTNKEISNILECSEFTIKSHKVSIMRKLGFTNSVEVSVWALKNKII